MSGFGEKKQQKRVLSKRLLQLSEKELKSKSIQSHIKGNLKDAETGYIAFINNGYLDADIYSNYALICEEKGELNKAIKLYKKCTSKFPNHVFSKLNLAFLYYKFNNLNQALSIVDEAIRIKPKLSNCYCIKGLILKGLNKYIESEELFIKAIGIDPEYFDATLNLGILYKETNKYDKAEKYHLKAIELNSNSAIALLNMGAFYKEIQKIDKAIFYTEKAIELDKKIKNAHLNLATIYSEKGDYEKSLLLAKNELILNKDNELAYQLISELIKHVDLKNYTEKEKRKILKNLFERKDISHREIFKNISSLVPPRILEKLSIPEDNISTSEEFRTLIKDDEIIKSLTLMIFCSPLWENILKNIRRSLLLDRSDTIKNNKLILRFLIALGTQCFLNEYVYYASQKEKDKINEIKKSLIYKQNIDFEIALISCYQPIVFISKEIRNFQCKDKDLNKLMKLQLEEKEISNGINKLGKISNSVSQKVKTQYESNPYPRWRYNYYSKEQKSNPISIINSEINPKKIESNEMDFTDKKVNILIAGCGTGIQIIEASRYNNCEITAIDLSKSSLNYAKSKVEDYGMKNVNFIEMDILELKKLNKKFNLIECSGVLHHMEDPIEGLSNLTESLELGGFLKLGLYSKYAREEILRAREIIKEKDIGTNLDEIRNFRNDVLNGNLKKITKVTNWSDFYSTSMCRDLCFHSQEKCYSLIEIKNMLEIANLEFLGFTISKDITDKYQSINEDLESLKDLQLWDKFEELHPNSFREMYQFWTRKSIK